MSSPITNWINRIPGRYRVNENVDSNDANESTPLVAPPTKKTEASLLYRAKLKNSPSWYIAHMVCNLGKNISTAKSPKELDRLLTKFEAIKFKNVSNGGQELAEGFIKLAYATHLFLSPGDSVTPEFERALRLVEKWTSEEEAKKSLGGYQPMVNIASQLYKSWVDHHIDAKCTEASNKIKEVLTKAEEFIYEGPRDMQKLKGKDTDDLLKAMAAFWYTIDAHGQPMKPYTKRTFQHDPASGVERMKVDPRI